MDESCYYLQIFALLMLIDYIPHFHEISQFFCTESPKCQGSDVILFQLNCIKIMKRRGKFKSGHFLLRLFSWFVRPSFYVWSIIKIGIENFKVPPSSKWYLRWRYMVCNFFILSLVNNASYLQTFVFGLILMHT